MEKDNYELAKKTKLELIVFSLILVLILIILIVALSIVPFSIFFRWLFLLAFISFTAVSLFSAYRLNRNNIPPIKYTSKGVMIINKILNFSVVFASEVIKISQSFKQAMESAQSSEESGKRTAVTLFWINLSLKQKLIVAGLPVFFFICLISIFDSKPSYSDTNRTNTFQVTPPKFRCVSNEYTKFLNDGQRLCTDSYERKKIQCNKLPFEDINACQGDNANKNLACIKDVFAEPCSNN